MAFGQLTPPTAELLAAVDKAEFVLEGTVSDRTQVRYASDGFIETLYEVEVASVLKGLYTQSTFWIPTAGGEIDGRVQTISHGSSVTPGSEGIFLLTSSQDVGVLYLASGNEGKILRLSYNDDFEALYVGQSDYYRSWRRLRESISAHAGIDVSLKPLTAERLESLGQGSKFCVKLDNPVPDVLAKTVRFDVLAKSSVAGLKFGRAEVLIDYPTGNLGEWVVDQEKVEGEKGDIILEPTYSIAVVDRTKEQMKLIVESDCEGVGPHYVLDTVYEKLATLTVQVNTWADLGTMNVSDFEVQGKAEYILPKSLSGPAPGCAEFDDLCGEGEIVLDFCSISSITTPVAAGIQDVVVIFGSKFGLGTSLAKILIPNAENGGANPPHVISATDSRFVKLWLNNQIVINVSNVTLGTVELPQPMSSGAWEVVPAPGSAGDLGCKDDVDVKYATRSRIDASADERRYLFVPGFAKALSPNGNFPASGELWVYIDGSIDQNPLAINQGITTATLEPIFLPMLVDMEIFTGYNICYKGITSATNVPPDFGRILLSVAAPPASSGNPVAFTAVGLEDIERCSGSTEVFSNWDASTINLNQNYSFYLGAGSSSNSMKYDLRSILLHELGHAFLLDHANDLNPANGTLDARTMYYQILAGQDKRQFSSEDLAGLGQVISSSYNFLIDNQGSSACEPLLLQPSLMDLNPDLALTCATSSVRDPLPQVPCADVAVLRNDNSFVVQSRDRVTIEIFSMSGQRLATTPSDGSSSFPISWAGPVAIQVSGDGCVSTTVVH